MSDGRRLRGERIASLRLVQFRDAASGAALTPRVLEIETKSGRYCHLEPSATKERVRLGTGPAQTAAHPDAWLRDWQDLTEALPGAFDGRPSVTALDPEDPKGPADGPAWTLVLSTGYRIRCAWQRGGLRLTGTQPAAEETPR